MILEKINKYIESVIKASDMDISIDDLENAIVNMGNRYRVAKVFEKAQRGEEIVISFFGGSITAGASAYKEPKEEYGKNPTFPSEANTYCDHICRWFEEMFPCTVKKENAGMGATDTPYAVHRMDEDVLSKNPDLVIVEFCANDGLNFEYKQGTYENMVRRFMDSGVALIMLSMATKTGASSQIAHEPIAKHYGVPHISYRNAYFENAEYEKLTNDTVHPNKIGHPLVGLIVNYYLGKVYLELENAEDSDVIMPTKTIHPDGDIYNGAFIASLKDIFEGKVEGARIKSLGSFSFDKEERCFVFRRYFGLTAEYSENYQPLVIEIDSVKTLFLQIFRSNSNKGSEFLVELNGEKIESNTFTCMHGTDNAQTEWSYHWATERLCYYPDRKKVELVITPNINPEYKSAKVRLYALLLS